MAARVKIADLILLPLLGAVVLYASGRIVQRAYAPETGPLKDLPRDIRRHIRALEAQDVNERRRAAMMLMLISSTDHRYSLAPAVPHFIEALKDTDVLVREHIGTALTNLGAEAVPGLAKALNDPASGSPLRMALIGALGEIGLTRPEAVQVLLETTNDPDETVARAAARVLEYIRRARRRPERR